MNKPGPSEADIDYDARFKALEKHPLFMRNLPEGESNPTLDALQSLIYDDTPNSESLHCVQVHSKRDHIAYISCASNGICSARLTSTNEATHVRLSGTLIHCSYRYRLKL